MVYMYHSFLIHSSADGYLGCFLGLLLKNEVAEIMLCVHQMSFDFSSSLGIWQIHFPGPLNYVEAVDGSWLMKCESKQHVSVLD